MNYTDVVGNTQISRFSVSDGDPNIANAASELKMLNLEQPFSNHNGDVSLLAQMVIFSLALVMAVVLAIPATARRILPCFMVPFALGCR